MQSLLLASLALVLLGAPGLALPSERAVALDDLRAGFGREDLPTPEGAPLAGYGGLRDRTARGAADPPRALAWALEGRDRTGARQRVVWVAADLVIMRPELRAKLAERVRDLSVGLLVATATHTHSGPGGYLEGWLPERITAGSWDPAAPDRLVGAMERATRMAVAALAPVRVAATTARAEHARNRRFEDGQHETALPLLRLDAAGRRPLVIVAYGAHPTVYSPRNRLYSADYPGALREALADAGYDALFLPGPLGDQAPFGPDAPDEAGRVERVGAGLAARVLEAVAGLQPRRATARFAERSVQAPPPRMRRFCALWWLSPLAGPSLRAFLSAEVPVHAVQVGGARLLALPAEPTSALGDRVRAGTGPADAIFVVAHSNDWLGYAVSEQTWDRGGYETCLSLHDRGFGAWLVEQAIQTDRALESAPRAGP